MPGCAYFSKDVGVSFACVKHKTRSSVQPTRAQGSSSGSLPLSYCAPFVSFSGSCISSPVSLLPANLPDLLSGRCHSGPRSSAVNVIPPTPPHRTAQMAESMFGGSGCSSTLTEWQHSIYRSPKPDQGGGFLQVAAGWAGLVWVKPVWHYTVG